MGYAAWSVIFGETPSTAKWNILGENDESFNDGTGIGNGVINNDHLVNNTIEGDKINFAATGADAGIWWEELGRTTLGGSADVITISSIPARKHLRIITHLIPSGNITTNLRFNNDSGANYAFVRDSGNSLSQSSIGTGNSSLHQYTLWDIINVATIQKQIWAETAFGSSGAGVAPTRDTTVGGWYNTTDQITRIDVINGGTGDFVSGSSIVVLGHD